MSGGHLSRLFSRVQPALTRSKAATYTNTKTNINVKTRTETTMADDSSIFVLDDYNNVPVTTQGRGLERDQLTQWLPFKVSSSTSTRSSFLLRRPPRNA